MFSKVAFPWDPIRKLTDIKFQTGLSFASVYMKKSYRGGRKLMHGKPIIINRYIKYITTWSFLCKFPLTVITYKLFTLLIKRRNSEYSQNQFLKRIWEMYLVFCGTLFASFDLLSVLQIKTCPQDQREILYCNQQRMF